MARRYRLGPARSWDGLVQIAAVLFGLKVPVGSRAPNHISKMILSIVKIGHLRVCLIDWWGS